MLTTIKKAFGIKELRKKIIFTLLILFIYRLGTYIPVPFVDAEALQDLVGDGGIFSLMDILSGGNFGNYTIFAMGITPYINASIIMNLLCFAIPALENMQKEGEEGRKKIEKYTIYLTLVLAVIQSLGLTLSMRDMLTESVWWTTASVVLITTAGTALLTYLGNLITENGIGNGISLIIFISIVSRIPSSIATFYEYLELGTINIIQLLLVIIYIVVALIGVVAVTEAQRKVPVQYAKRVVGRKQYGGQSTFIPIRLNMSGVIPIIFASSLTLFPATIASFFPSSAFAEWVSTYLAWGSLTATLIYVVLIFAFTYFYTAITFNPYDVAENIQKQGGYIPGIRPGVNTVKYLSGIVNKLTIFGALFLVVIAVIPIIVGNILGGISLQFGGTSLLIIVGVALEVVKQLESEMTMREYSGFLK